MARIDFRYLDRAQVRASLPSRSDLLAVIEAGLAAHGRGNVVLPPKSHIQLDDLYNGHFNILVGWAQPNDMAGVKVIGDYVDNYKLGLPSEIAMLTLYDPRTGIPRALMDATDLTHERTGAVTGIGARLLAPKSSKVVAHIGARGTAFANIACLATGFDLSEVRINSKRPETREALVRRIQNELGLKAIAVSNAREACANADIVIEATRLEKPSILIKDSWLKERCLVITYGWKMAIDPETVRSASAVIVDDWEQCCKGGALHPMIEGGELTRGKIYAEIGEIAAGNKPPPDPSQGRVIFWHRGFAISDIMLGAKILANAAQHNRGTILNLFDLPDE